MLQWAKPIPEPMTTFCSHWPYVTFMGIYMEMENFPFKEMYFNMSAVCHSMWTRLTECALTQSPTLIWTTTNISSHVKFGITYYHYYHICFFTPQCNHRYGLIVYGRGKITYSCHLYFMNKFVLYILIPVPIVSHIVFCLYQTIALWVANVICWL